MKEQIKLDSAVSIVKKDPTQVLPELVISIKSALMRAGLWNDVKDVLALHFGECEEKILGMKVIHKNE